MVNEIESIRTFLASSEYRDLAAEIIESTQKRLGDDLYDAEIAYCEKARSSAELTIGELTSLLIQERGALKDFCTTYIKSERALDSGQEYNPAEAEDQPEAANETYVGHSQTFLFSYAVLFFLLKHKRSHLPTFLKKIRKPNASKYQKAVESVFDALT
jgi:hypothetical protein